MLMMCVVILCRRLGTCGLIAQRNEENMVGKLTFSAIEGGKYNHVLNN